MVPVLKKYCGIVIQCYSTAVLPIYTYMILEPVRRMTKIVLPALGIKKFE